MEYNNVTEGDFSFSFLLPSDYYSVKLPFSTNYFDRYLFVDCFCIYKKKDNSSSFFTISKCSFSQISNKDSIINDYIKRTVSSLDGLIGPFHANSYWLNFGHNDSIPFYMTSSFSPHFRNGFIGDSINATVSYVLFIKDSAYKFSYYTITSIYNFPYENILRTMNSIKIKEVKKE